MSSRPPGWAADLQGRVAAMRLRLSPRRNEVTLARGIEVPMRDGTVLLADHYSPVGTDARPTLLVRTPYGRRLPFRLLLAQLFAERGYHVLLQSVRGTFGSGGSFRPFVDDARDAQDTVAWLRNQPWFDRRLGTVGGSYQGFVQFALAADPPPELKAVVVHFGPHDLARAVWGQGPFALYSWLAWSYLGQTDRRVGRLAAVWRVATVDRKVRKVANALPLAPRTLLGTAAPWVDEWLENPDMGSALYAGARHGHALQRLEAPTLLIGGWHDLFLDQTLEQYRTLRGRGVDVAMTVGPWAHNNVIPDFGTVIDESIDWLDVHLAGESGPARTSTVRVHVGGVGQWVDRPEWPPAEVVESNWYVRSGHRLDPLEPDEQATSTAFRYDPLDPTPSVGGRILLRGAGARDNTELERRDDVVVFSSEPLAAPVEIMGEPVVELVVATDNPHADLFARLCDVDADGTSHNVCDQILRLDAGDRPRLVRVPLVGAAHRFATGHRIRLQVSGGAHPRFTRNLGTGGPETGAATAPTTFRIEHGAASRLVLPVVTTAG